MATSDIGADPWIKKESSPSPSCASTSTSTTGDESTCKRSFDQAGLGESPSTSRKPMRKRAKTQEEKEARAQERIMRNRAAAQVSRERKREYVVTLEAENKSLNDRISSLTSENTNLRSTVSSLTQRLENLEKMLYHIIPQGGYTPFTRSIADDISAENPVHNITQAFELPTPPGTVRPLDLQSAPTAQNPGLPIDSRNPAVIAFGPQRRSMGFPWNLSSQSPIYRQMISIISFWTTTLRAITLQAFVIRMISYHLLNFRRLSLCRTVNYRRSSATCSLSRTEPSLQVDAGFSGEINHLFQLLSNEEESIAKGLPQAPRL